jgi:hypothetical protein
MTVAKKAKSHYSASISTAQSKQQIDKIPLALTWDAKTRVI